MIEGFLVYAGDGFFKGTNTSAQYGCGDLDPTTNPSWKVLSNDPTVDSVILLIDRNPTTGSGCTFSTKVFSAQNAPAGKVIAVLIVDQAYDTGDSGAPYLLMRDDDRGTQVKISSMFIGKPIWDILFSTNPVNWDHLNKPYDCYVEMEYYLPNPDGRVEMDLLYSIFDPNAVPFLTSFGAAARVLAYRLKTTPHFWLVDGANSYCANPTLPKCTSNCVITSGTTGRYYCQSPATLGVLSNVSGVLGLQEVVRQYCLFTFLQGYPAPSTSPAVAYPEPYTYLMWSYWELFYANCVSYTSLGRFSAACSYSQMTAMNTGGTVTINMNNITGCVTTASRAAASGNIALFDQYLADWQTFNPPINSARAFINLTPYPGDVACLSPITENTCGILSGICYGYSETDPKQPYPVQCNWDHSCPFGTQNCTGVTRITGDSGGGGVSAGAVVGIIIAFLVILVAALYYWYRKQQMRMKSEVDALLKQYLPMDPGATHGVAQGSTKVREQQERRLIQDMDLEDQDLETRDDI